MFISMGLLIFIVGVALWMTNEVDEKDLLIEELQKQLDEADIVNDWSQQ